MSTPSKSVNAWILPSEDDPSGTSYQSPNSSYQSLITYGVYNYLDMVNICFADTLPTSGTTVPTGDGSTYTIQLTAATHPDGYTNQDYMNWIIQDARQANPNIKVLITLGYAADEFTQIFSGDQNQWPAQAASYANNVVAYLKNYGLNRSYPFQRAVAMSIEIGSALIAAETKEPLGKEEDEMNMEISSALIAASGALVSAVATVFVRHRLENRRLQPVASRRAAIAGRWTGEIADPKYPDGGIVSTAVVTFNPGSRRVTGSARVISSLAAHHRGGPRESTIQSELTGGFRHGDFLMLEYRSKDASVLQFGAMILLLNGEGNRLDGMWIGYGRISEAIVSGTMTLVKGD